VTPRIDALLLGPLELHVGSTTFRIPGARQRALLACLLLARGRPLATAELVESVYGTEADQRTVHSLHELVSSLRRSLETVELDGRLRSTPGGYVLDLDLPELDVSRFETLLAEAQIEKDSEAQSDLLRRALDHWRGRALEGTEVEAAARAEVERLDELRAGALADWLDIELAAGRHQAALAELERATQLSPYNERLRAQLMLALYREGRQGDALRVYQETRRLLADDLGLEPTEPLRALERQILNQDPGLRTPPARRRRRSLTKRSKAIATAAALAAVAAGATAAAGVFTGRTGAAPVFADSMKGAEINTRVWDVETAGVGATVRADGAGALLTIPAHATPTDPSGELKAVMSSYCTLAGEFDIQVDYALNTWPGVNGAGIGMYAAYADVIRESMPTGEQYIGAHRLVDPPDGTPRAVISTSDTRGSLRIVRSPNRMIEFVRGRGAWRQVYSFRDPTPAAVSVYLELWTNAQRFAHRQVEAQLTNFRVNTGNLQCPTG